MALFHSQTRRHMIKQIHLYSCKDTYLDSSFLEFHYIMSIQYVLTPRLRTRQGSVFNVTVLNNMCALSWLVYMPYIPPMHRTDDISIKN